MRGLLAMAICLTLGCNTSSIGSNNHQSKASSHGAGIVVITDAAAVAVRKFMATDPSADYLEVSVMSDPSAPTGFRYNLSLTSNPSPSAFELTESNGIKIATDVKSIKYLRGTKIDWVPLAEGNEGFYFHNPNSHDVMPDSVRKHYESTNQVPK